MVSTIRRCIVFFVVTALTAALPITASAQEDRLTIWDIPLGTDVRDLPDGAVALIACGTNGGPPSIPLSSFSAFETCPREPETGLREVQFVYDDELENIALAYGNEAGAMQVGGTRVSGFESIVSLLVDEAGITQGFRIVSDPRAADLGERNRAVALGDFLVGHLGASGWACVDALQETGFQPADGRYVNRVCTKADRQAGWEATIIQHHFRKPGQAEINPFNWRSQPGYLESSTRLELTASLPGAEPVEWAWTWDTPSLVRSEVIDCPGCDLSGANLKRFDLAGANLSGASLRNANLHDADLTSANLSGADLTGANLNKARLTRANLSEALLQDAMLFRADLSASNLTDADLTGARIGRSRLTRATLVGAVLNRTDLWGASLSDADLTGSEIKGARIVDGNLNRVNLTDAVLDGSILAFAQMNGAVLRGASAMGVDLYGARMRGADLTNVNFTGARLTASVMIDVVLSGTIFEDAIMQDGRVFIEE